MHLHELFDIASGIVLVCSLLYSFLPPYEIFADFPRFQKIYKVFTQVIARWGGLNLKSVVYPQIKSVENAAGTVTPAPDPKK